MTETTTTGPVDLDSIRTRANAATEGPWGTLPGLHPWEVCIAADVPLVELSHSDQGRADAEFIAHAREDVPALIAEVAELRTMLDYERRSRSAYEERVSEQVENLRDEIDERDATISSLRDDLDFQTKAAFVNQAEVNRLRAQLDAIRVLHTDSPAGFCPSCYRQNEVSDTDDGLVAWPCPTLQAMGIEAVAR